MSPAPSPFSRTPRTIALIIAALFALTFALTVGVTLWEMLTGGPGR